MKISINNDISLSLLLNHNNVEIVIKREQKEIYKITIILNQSLIILVNFGFANVHFFLCLSIEFLISRRKENRFIARCPSPFFSQFEFFRWRKISRWLAAALFGYAHARAPVCALLFYFFFIFYFHSNRSIAGVSHSDA